MTLTIIIEKRVHNHRKISLKIIICSKLNEFLTCQQQIVLGGLKGRSHL